MEGLLNLNNIHPLFVHFPVALSISALLFELLYLVTNKDAFRLTGTSLVYLTALAAAVTIVTGYMAAGILGHNSPGHDLVHYHRDIMLVFTGLWIVLAIVNYLLSSERFSRYTSIWQRTIRPILITGAVIIMIIGADKGGQMVFVHGIGVNPRAFQAEDNSTSMPGIDLSVPDSVKQEAPPTHDGHEHSH